MQTIYWNLQADNETEILKAAGCLLRQGEVVAFPTETVYGLGADGLNGTAVAKIFAAKGRPVDNPLILHIARVEDIFPLQVAVHHKDDCRIIIHFLNDDRHCLQTCQLRRMKSAVSRKDFVSAFRVRSDNQR